MYVSRSVRCEMYCLDARVKYFLALVHAHVCANCCEFDDVDEFMLRTWKEQTLMTWRSVLRCVPSPFTQNTCGSLLPRSYWVSILPDENLPYHALQNVN